MPEIIDASSFMIGETSRSCAADGSGAAEPRVEWSAERCICTLGPCRAKLGIMMGAGAPL